MKELKPNFQKMKAAVLETPEKQNLEHEITLEAEGYFEWMRGREWEIAKDKFVRKLMLERGYSLDGVPPIKELKKPWLKEKNRLS